METWSDNGSFSSDEKPKVEARINLCLMVIDDEVCNDQLDDYDTL